MTINIKRINEVFLLFSGKNEGITFLDNENPIIIGFSGILDGSGYHIGYKMLDTFENVTMADDEEKILSKLLSKNFQSVDFQLRTETR